jgi:hypothetical protein
VNLRCSLGAVAVQMGYHSMEIMDRMEMVLLPITKGGLYNIYNIALWTTFEQFLNRHYIELHA